MNKNKRLFMQQAKQFKFKEKYYFKINVFNIKMYPKIITEFDA